MRLPLLLILPFLLFGILLDIYICRAVALRCVERRKLWLRVAVGSSIFFNLAMVILISWPKKSGSEDGLAAMMWVLYAYLSIYLSKALFVIVDLIGKIPRLAGKPKLGASAPPVWCSAAWFSPVCGTVCSTPTA